MIIRIKQRKMYRYCNNYLLVIQKKLLVKKLIVAEVRLPSLRSSDKVMAMSTFHYLPKPMNIFYFK